MASVDLLIRIATEAKNAAGDLDKVAGDVGSFSDKMSAMAGPAAIAGAAVAGLATVAIGAASDLQQALGATDTVFGSNAATVKGWAEGAAGSVGLAESSYLGLANTIGAQLGNAGISMDQAAGNTNDLITMGADLAATFGGDTATAVAALSSALKGEADPAEKYGLNLSAAAVAAQMAADGTSDLTGEAKTAAKAQAVMALATEQSAKTAGQFAREADTAEGATQRAKAGWTNAAAAIGTLLLPAVQWLAEAFANVAKWAQENATLVAVLGGIIGGLAVAILAVNAALKIAAVAQAAFNAVMAMNPVMLVIIAVVALIAAIVLLWNKCEWFRNGVIAIWEAIKAAAIAVWDAIGAAIGAVVDFVVGIVAGAGAAISAVWNAIKSAAESVWNAIKSTVSTVASAISGFIEGAKSVIGGIWDAIKSAAETAWNAIKGTVDTVASAISGFIEGVKNTLGGIWSAIQSAGEAVWQPIADAAHAAIDWIEGVLSDISGAIGSVVDALSSALSWAGDLWDKIVNMPSPEVPPMAGGVMAPVGFAAVSPSLARRGLMAAPRASTGSASGGNTFIIQGAIDPDGVARQVQAILRRRERRSGTVVAGVAGIAPA